MDKKYGGYTAAELREFIADSEFNSEGLDSLFGDDAVSANVIHDLLDALSASAEATQAVAVPEGWKLVPAEATQTMILAGAGKVSGRPQGKAARYVMAEAYAAMLAAAPQAPVADAARADTLALEIALSELVNKIDSDLDTGDLVKDARRASAALDAILTKGDLVANAHDYFRDTPHRYERSIEFRIGWNACLDALQNARAAAPAQQAVPLTDDAPYRWLCRQAIAVRGYEGGAPRWEIDYVLRGESFDAAVRAAIDAALQSHSNGEAG